MKVDVEDYSKIMRSQTQDEIKELSAEIKDLVSIRDYSGAGLVDHRLQAVQFIGSLISGYQPESAAQKRIRIKRCVKIEVKHYKQLQKEAISRGDWIDAETAFERAYAYDAVLRLFVIDVYDIMKEDA